MFSRWWPLQKLGAGLVCLGVVWLLFAWNMTVTAPGSRVVNIGLLDDRRNQILIGALITLAGVISAGFGSLRVIGVASQRTAPVSTEPPCARDLTLDPYKIWLVDYYAIVRNETLGLFVCGDKLFATLDEALQEVHSRELSRAEELARAAAEAALSTQRAEEQARVAAQARQLAAEDARQHRREWVRSNPIKFGCSVLVVVAVLSSGALYLLHQSQLRAEARVASEVRVAMARTAVENAEAEFQTADRQWHQEHRPTIAALENEQLDKIRFSLLRDNYGGFTYAVRVQNGSRYHIESMSGDLVLYSNGIEIPVKVRFSCCKKSTDRSGFNLGYSLAPGDASVVDTAVMSVQLEARDPSDRKYAADRQLALRRDILGNFQFVPDQKAGFAGTVKYVVPAGKIETASTITYRTSAVDFAALADQVPRVAALRKVREAAAARLASKRASLEAAMADLERARD